MRKVDVQPAPRIRMETGEWGGGEGRVVGWVSCVMFLRDGIIGGGIDDARPDAAALASAPGKQG